MAMICKTVLIIWLKNIHLLCTDIHGSHMIYGSDMTRFRAVFNVMAMFGNAAPNPLKLISMEYRNKNPRYTVFYGCETVLKNPAQLRLHF